MDFTQLLLSILGWAQNGAHSNAFSIGLPVTPATLFAIPLALIHVL